MKRLHASLAPLVWGMALAAIPAFGWDYKEEAREPVKHIFAAGATTLEVHNINGSVTVLGDGGNTMRVEGEKVIRAADRQELEQGKKEVTLDLNEKAGVAQVYVNGPFRRGSNRNNNEDPGFQQTGRRNYEVVYNLTIHVPRASALQLHSVNGAGKVETVNGKIEATFQPNLAANLHVKTFNGEAYTDFETTAVANTAATVEQKDGRRVIRHRDARILKVGAGGPDISFETLNGGIEIRKAH